MFSEIPSVPGAPNVLEIGNDFVNLHWKEPEYDGNNPPLYYTLEYCNITDKKLVNRKYTKFSKIFYPFYNLNHIPGGKK